MGDYTYLILAAVVVVIVVAIVYFLFKKLVKLCLIGGVLYLAVYAALSVAGHYVLASGQHKEWCPKYLVEEHTSLTGQTETSYTHLGVIYSPCILADHWFWHRTVAE